MKTIRYWLAAIAVIGSLAAIESRSQTNPPPQDNNANVITRSIQLTFADPYQIKTTLDPIAKANGTVIAFDSLKKVLILAGNPERINEMETLIRRLDVSPPVTKGIEVTGYLLSAGDTTTPNAPESTPAAIEPALKQLRATFNYKSYQLLDIIFLRNRLERDGGTQGSMRLPDYIDPKTGAASPRAGGYTFGYARSYLTHDEKGDVLHFDGVHLAITNGGTISTNIDLRPGQLVVVGKTDYLGGNSALIAIITAKIID